MVSRAADRRVDGEDEADQTALHAVGRVAEAAVTGDRHGHGLEGRQLRGGEHGAPSPATGTVPGVNHSTRPRSPTTMSPPVPLRIVSAPWPPKMTSGSVEVLGVHGVVVAARGLRDARRTRCGAG